MNTNTIKRVPRPYGSTYASISSKQDPETLIPSKQRIIGHWLQNHTKLNGELVTIEELARYLNLPIEQVQKLMWSEMKKQGKWIDKKDAGQLARVIFSKALILGIEIQSESHNQLQVLKESQAGRYQPFISSTVNQAIQNLISAHKINLDLLKVITDKPDINIIFNNSNIDNRSVNTLTADTALKLINERTPSMLQDPHMADEKAQQYQAHNLLPNINARTQDLSQIGIKNTPITANENAAKDSQPHTSRRDLTTIENSEDFNI